MTREKAGKVEDSAGEVIEFVMRSPTRAEVEEARATGELTDDWFVLSIDGEANLKNVEIAHINAVHYAIAEHLAGKGARQR